VGGNPLVNEGPEIDAGRITRIPENGSGYHPAMDKEFITVEAVGSKLQVAHLRSLELCLKSVQLRRESDRLRGRASALGATPEAPSTRERADEPYIAGDSESY
jgi:hypothetical protein